MSQALLPDLSITHGGPWEGRFHVRTAKLAHAAGQVPIMQRGRATEGWKRRIGGEGLA